jgi:hypothetical protein
MIRFLRKVARPWAVFFALITIGNTLLPTVSWALTSGPTAPEATSFEPVDTTDMVNLATGDFTYNIPLLEVPGPAGGYPLSLSYHAGIQPNEDASWVGLGWTLNPGAISRTVNGYPDDQLGAVRTRRDYNNGGQRNTFSVGVGVPGATLNISISNDSNLGLGVGTSLSIGPSFKIEGTGVGIGADFTVGDDGYGNSYKGLSVGIAIGKAGDGARGLTANLGFSTNFNSVSGSAGIGLDFGANKSAGRYTASLVGASISSNGLKPSMSVGGYDLKQTSSFAGRATTESWGISTPPIPIGPFTLTLGYNYMRYYSDETSDVNVIGTLNASNTNGKNPDDWSFDSYALLDPDAEGGVTKNNDPDKSKGGSFPAYDSYQVNAQGLGGSIQPYIFDKGTLFRQNLKKSDNSGYIIKFLGSSVTNDFGFNRPVNFRFKNDFSNSLTYESANLRINSTGGIAVQTTETVTPTEGYNYETTQLAGSKHVEYFTNQQIKDGVAKAKGFIDYKSSALRETNKFGFNVSSQIGGFMITNESGVTYHYSLPVYAYNQYSKSFKTGKENDIFQTNTDYHPYAYTWYLTAITGPDYVNRNPLNDGTISKNDFGYWVKLDYGLYLSNYVWRNPIEGTHKDIDQEVEQFSYGSKEIFYLDRIETASHIASFLKGLREDGKGVTNGLTGGFQSIPYQECKREKLDHGWREYDCVDLVRQPGTTQKLVRIALLKRADFESGGDISAKASRIIDFETDYSLTPGTINSFPVGNISSKLGKLTLKSLSFKGKSGADLIPPMTFQYAKNPPFNKDAYDIWGHYKSDFQPTTLNTQESLGRLTTKASGGNVDAWSLTNVKSSLGSEIQINYESDTYLNSLALKGSLFIKEVVPEVGSNISKVKFYNSIDLSESRQILVSEQIRLLGLLRQRGQFTDFYNTCVVDRVRQGTIYLWEFFDLLGTVVEVGVDYLRIDSHDLASTINRIYGNQCVECNAVYVNGSSSDCATYRFANKGFFLGGNILLETNQLVQYGGGLRVKSISLNSVESISTSNYTYNSGTTSYEPINLQSPIIEIYPFNSWIMEKQTKAVNSYKTEINKQFSKLLSISREVPAPGVLYKTVTVEEEILNVGETAPTKIPGRKVYEFQTFDEEFIKRIGITSLQEPPYTARCISMITGEQVGTTCPSGSVPPFRCFDQYGNQIGCGIVPSRAYSPLTLKDFSAWVGTLKKVTTYGADNQILNEVENKYLHDNKTTDQFASDLKTKFKNQGVVSQVFGEYRIADDVAMPIVSRRDEYPLVSIGQTSRDFKTGITTSTENLAFDFYTGNPTKVLSTDGYGNTYVAETVPAYSIPEYSGMTTQQINAGTPGMGLKVNNPKNKNMLTQSAGSFTYKVNSDYRANQTDVNKLALVSATAQTWSDQTLVMGAGGNNLTAQQPGIWRMKSSFSFVGDNAPLAVRGDGLQPMPGFQPFANWTTHQEMSGWQKNSEITLYDYHSHAIEATDVNGNYAATKFDNNHAQVLATAANASYNELAYSGAEEATATSGTNQVFGGGVIHSGSGISTTSYHTGSKSVISHTTTQRGFTYKFTGNQRAYNVSVWANRNDAKIKYKLNNGATSEAVRLPVRQAGAWYLVNAQVPVAANNTVVEVWCEANRASTLFDDFRVHPVDAAMTSYVYNNWGELTHILDNNNLYTEYRYDGMGRLKETYKETFQTAYGNQGVVKVSEFAMNYGVKAPPYTVSLQVTSTGGSGAVSPLGSINVPFNTDQVVTLSETCPNGPQLRKVSIDGAEINLNNPTYTLRDGGTALVSGSSVVFKKMKTGHTLAVEYNQYNSDAGYRCETVNVGSGNTCPTGGFEIGTRDQCGTVRWSRGVGTPPSYLNCCASPPPGCNCNTPIR